MKLKTKFAALAATVCLLGGALVGCGDDPEPTPVVNKYYVTPPQASADYEVAGINAEGYDAGATVTFTVTMKTEMKVVKNVKWDTTVITAGTDGKYSFTMPERNVTISVALDSYVLSISGKLEVGETGTVKLNLGNDAIQDFAVEGKTDADKAKITLVGKEITFDEVGEVTLVATRVNKVVAEKKFTISESTRQTILKAFTKAWAEVEGFADNTKSGSDIVSTPERVSLEGQVIFVGAPYTNKGTTTVELLIDDGSMIVQTTCKLASETEKWTACEVGDVVSISQFLANATGLLQASRISEQKWITKVEGKSYTPQASKVYTADEYKAAAAVFEKNDQMRLPIPMEIDVVGAPEEVDGAMKDRFLVKGVTPNEGSVINKLALTKSVIKYTCVEGAEYHIKGILLSKGSSYLNFVASEFEKAAAESVTIKGDATRELKVDASLTLEYETTPKGSGKVVQWVSSNPTNVKVEDGVVTALVKGASETIKVVVDGHESNAITINVPNISVTALDISGELTTKEYNVGDALNVAGLKVTATFDDESTDDTYADKVEWVVNPATFTAEGEEVGVSVVAKLGDVESAAFATQVKVTVKPGSDKDHPLDADAAYDIGAKMANYGTSEEVYFVKGVVTGFYNEAEKGKTVPVLGSKSFQVDTTLDTSFTEQVEKGAVIVASGKLFHISSAVTFTNKYESKVYYDDTNVALVEITGESSVSVNSELQLAGKAYPEKAATGALVWESSDDTVATVDQTGKVTGVAAGKVTISVTCDGIKAEHALTVTAGDLSTIAKVTFTNTNSTTALTDANADESIKGWLNYASEDQSAKISSFSKPSFVYAGANGGNGATAYTVQNALKIGKASAGGSLIITLAEGVKASKIVITGYAWKNTLKVGVNGETAVSALTDNLANKANCDAGLVGTFELNFEASNVITIATESTAIIITSLEILG